VPYRPRTILDKHKRPDHWFWTRYSAYPYKGCSTAVTSAIAWRACKQMAQVSPSSGISTRNTPERATVACFSGAQSIGKSVDMLFDTCYNGVAGLARAALVSQELSVDAASEGVQIIPPKGRIRGRMRILHVQ
jgi:hypothetical protein